MCKKEKVARIYYNAFLEDMFIGIFYNTNYNKNFSYYLTQAVKSGYTVQLGLEKLDANTTKPYVSIR